jgi:hypothetical protein
MKTAVDRVGSGKAREVAVDANDVCAALELGNPSQALKSHVDGDDLTKRDVIDSLCLPLGAVNVKGVNLDSLSKCCLN